VQRIGRRLDRAVHVTIANGLVLCVPFVVCDAASMVADTLTSDDWNGYILWLVIGSVLEIWARATVVCMLRGDRLVHALGAALRRPVLLVYALAACAEPWLTDYGPSLVGLPLFFAGSLIVFATMLALVGTVADGVPPVRSLAYWLREMCRPRRLGVNLAGALIVACLWAVAPDVIAAELPGAGSQPTSYLYALLYGIADAIAMAFVVFWHDAALDDRYGRDIEHLLDAKPA
jgi:hypothetical protein